MAWLRRLLFLLLFPAAAFGQGYRYDNFVLKPLITGGLTPVSGALITVCTLAGTGTPCTPKVANIYSDEALTTPITGTGGAGTTNSDANGNFGFYAASGSYVITVTGSGITSYTIKAVFPSGLGTANTFNTLTVGPVGSALYQTIAAAQAACPAFGCSIFVRNDATPDTATISITKPLHITFDNMNYIYAQASAFLACTTGVEGVRISGQSRNGTGNSTGSLIQISNASGIGANFTNCPGALIDNINFSGAGSGSGANNKGLVLSGHDISVQNVLVSSFGNDGVIFDGSVVNTNDCKFWNSRSQNNGGVGVRFTGANANDCTAINSSAGGNLGVGFLVTGTAQFEGFYNTDTAGNAAIGYQLNGPNNILFAFSDAPNAPETAAIQFDAAGSNNEVHCLKNAMPINTDNGSGNRYYGCGGTFGSGASAWNQVNASHFVTSVDVQLTERTPISGSSGLDLIWGGSDDNMPHFNPNNRGIQQVPMTAFVTSAYTNATTTFSTVTNMSFAVAASRNYTLACHLYLQGSATTAGPKFQLTGPAAPTAVLLSVNPFDPIAKTTTNVSSGFSTANTTFGTIGALAVNYDVILAAGIVNGVNAGTVVLQAAANGAGTLTIQPGSFCRFQ